MPQEKFRKFKRTSKHKNDEKSKMIDCVEEQYSEKSEGPRIKHSLKGLKTVGSSSRKHKAAKCVHSKEKSAKQVHIAFLPDKYEPLEEDQDLDIPKIEKEDAKKKNKKHKKLRNNLGKALRYSWKCLVAGLQSFSAAYSGPLGAAATLIPEIRR
ncbi:required for drug-induced death protein 1 [Brachyhypopomus gauderio]|uniref:required for drug-induced death protein 1 n=1 Tax=Brachyhypopomus gauderio TaxID=698409 RepID=UPI00404390BD